jgi:outer membrane protein insertion porin family
MMGLEMARCVDAGRKSGLAAVLLGSTILAGVPVSAMAQDAVPTVEPVAPAVAPAPPSQVGETIKAIQVVGAERLEPQTRTASSPSR